MDKISVVVPCYNEEESLPLFYEEIIKVSKSMKDVDFEYLFIDDGSKDKTLEIMRELHEKDKRVRFVSFSRNFGKESAIYAGLKATTGDYIAVMDADLQDPPSLLPEMYKSLKEEDYDQVATRRSTRKGEPPIRSMFARLFYKLINKISKAEIVDGARDYRLMKRVVVNAILSLSEYNRFSKGIYGWVGFKTKWLSYENIERVAGSTKWNFFKLTIYAIDGIVAFSTVPLAIPFISGTSICFLSFINFIIKLIVQASNLGTTFLIFTLGLFMICLGIVAEYLSKTYTEVQKRPIYFVRENEEGLVESNC